MNRKVKVIYPSLRVKIVQQKMYLKLANIGDRSLGEKLFDLLILAFSSC
ncbi:hypothetical protein [Nostoc sp.]